MIYYSFVLTRLCSFRAKRKKGICICRGFNAASPVTKKALRRVASPAGKMREKQVQ